MVGGEEINADTSAGLSMNGRYMSSGRGVKLGAEADAGTDDEPNIEGDDLGLVEDLASSMTCSGASFGLEKDGILRCWGVEPPGEPGVVRPEVGLEQPPLELLVGPKVVKAKLNLPDSPRLEPADELLPWRLC